MRRFFPGVLLLAACCRMPTAPETPLVATVSVSPSTFRSGDSVRVTVTVVNRSKQTQLIEMNQCDGVFVVKGPDGSVVGPERMPCFTYNGPLSLASGEQYSWMVPWSGRGSGPGSAQPLAPGTYVVVGSESIPLAGKAKGITLIQSKIEVTP